MLTQCSKCKTDPTPADPTSQLPPATQTGADTFGCLLNGRPWTPRGNAGVPNYVVTYDPSYHGGNLDIRTYNVIANTGKPQFLGFGGDHINQVGTYSFITPPNFPTPGPRNVYFSDVSKSAPCNDYSYNPGTTTSGELVITRLDAKLGIISGTFHFTLAQPGCDTLRFTQGRFDKTL